MGCCRMLGKTMVFLPQDVRVMEGIKALGVIGGEDPSKESPEYGGVYFVRSKDAVKIGYSRDWRKRLKGLQTSSPDHLTVLAVYFGTRDLERELHQKFSHLRLRANGEWFSHNEEIAAFIEENRHACLKSDE